MASRLCGNRRRSRQSARSLFPVSGGYSERVPCPRLRRMKALGGSQSEYLINSQPILFHSQHFTSGREALQVSMRPVVCCVQFRGKEVIRLSKSDAKALAAFFFGFLFVIHM